MVAVAAVRAAATPINFIKLLVTQIFILTAAYKFNFISLILLAEFQNFLYFY